MDISNVKLTTREEETIKTGRGNSYNNKSRQSYMAQPNVKEFNKAFVPKALTGNRYKWDNIEELESELSSYFELCAKTDTVPTITAIATWLHCNRDTIYAHANNPNSPFSDVLKSVLNICHTSLENGAIDGKINPVTYIFMGKNYFSLSDSRDINIKADNNNQSVNSIETMDAIKKQIEAETIPNADFHED